jgi:two-component system, OmpR family, response regulator
MRVLVVDDDRPMAHHICRALTEESWAVDTVHDGERALELAGSVEYDVIVLDRMLPTIDGLAVCHRLREAGCTTLVLMLSARDTVDDRIHGLDAGADDYLVKPFAVRELAARLHALLRRRHGSASPVLRVGDLEVDPSTRIVRRGSREIALTAKEYALLEFLMRRPGVIHTRSIIAEHVWDFPLDSASNVVDVYIKHLRDKIDGPVTRGARSIIQSVRGVGYVLRVPGAPEN